MKKNASTYVLFSAVTLLLISGCTKSLKQDQSDPLLTTNKPKSALTPLGTTPDIYVAGSDNGQAVYWKNGTEVSLTGGQMATGIVAIGSNVYVCGYGINPSTGMQTVQYWLNGTLTNLTGASTFPLTSGIAVSSSGDVYICGYDLFTNQAWYWKNSVIHTLPSGEPTGIAVSSAGDVYMSNGIQASSGPSYYKNGVLTTLSGGTSSDYLLAVATQGTNFYVVGEREGTTEHATRWDNGSPVILNSGFTYNTAMAVALNPTTHQVYASGTLGNDANNLQIGWWNHSGDANLLTSLPAKYESTSTGIAVDGSDTKYVCATVAASSTAPAVAWYWAIAPSGSVNAVQLSSGTTNATAHAITLGQ